MRFDFHDEFERHDKWQTLTAEQQQAVKDEQQRFIVNLSDEFKKFVKTRVYLAADPFWVSEEDFALYITTYKGVSSFDIWDVQRIIEVAEEFDTYEIKFCTYKGKCAICIGFRYVDGMEKYPDLHHFGFM